MATKRTTNEITIPEPAETTTKSVLTPYLTDGLLTLRVLVAHDAVMMGETIRVPLSERTAGLIEIGFLEVVVDDQY